MAKKNNISPERKELAKRLVKEFDLKTVGDAQNLLKDLCGPIIQGTLNASWMTSLATTGTSAPKNTKPNIRIGHAGRLPLHPMEMWTLRYQETGTVGSSHRLQRRIIEMSPPT